jgi:hypothetical protein
MTDDTGGGVASSANESANNLLHAAEQFKDSAVDFGEDAAREAIGLVIKANKLIGEGLESISAMLVGSGE